MINPTLQTGIFYLLKGMSAQELRNLLLEQVNKVDLAKLEELKGPSFLSEENFNAVQNRHIHTLMQTNSLNCHLGYFEQIIQDDMLALKRATDLGCTIPLRNPSTIWVHSL